MNKKEKALFEKAKKLIDDKRIEIIKYANENNSSHLELVKKDIFQLKRMQVKSKKILLPSFLSSE